MKAPLCLLILLIAWTTLYAQTKMGVQPLAAGTEQRKALLIGNRNYTHFRPLANTERDVDAMATLLRKLNFVVTVYKNLDYKGTVQAIANFKASLRPDDVALVYYSGHSIGTGGQSYLLPVESDIQCTSELEAYGPLSLNALVTGLAARQVRNSFVFLDACRNLPISNCNRTKGKDDVRGLLFPKNNPKGNLIVFATGEGETADDDKYDKTNSLFTAELLKNLGTPNLGIREIMDNVIEGVEARSGGKQIPQKWRIYGGILCLSKRRYSLLILPNLLLRNIWICPLLRWPISLAARFRWATHGAKWMRMGMKSRFIPLR